METVIKDYVIVNLETKLIHIYYLGEEFVLPIEEGDDISDYWNSIILSNGDVNDVNIHNYDNDNQYTLDIYSVDIDNMIIISNFFTINDVTIIE